MSEKIYIVTLHKKEDLEGFYTEMESKGFVLDAKREISRNTHYWMTEEQAIELRKDSRVWDVEGVEDIKWKREANREPYTISGDFGKNSLGGPLVRQWGQVHCAGNDAQRGKGSYGANDVINTSVDNLIMVSMLMLLYVMIQYHMIVKNGTVLQKVYQDLYNINGLMN